MYSTIKAKVVDQTLTITSVGKLTSGGENEVRVEVSFDSYWVGYGKTAIFYREEKHVYHVVMVSDACVIPRDVLTAPGRLYFGILGTSGSSVRTTEVVTFNVVQGAITAGVSQPLPDVYKQLMSAYGKAINDIAVEKARVDNLTNASTVDGELIDIRVGVGGKTYATAGEAVRVQHSSAKQTAERALSGYAASAGYLYDLSSLDFWEQGWISSTDGKVGNTGSENNVYIRTVDFIPETVEFIASESGRRFHVYRYSKAGAFVDRMTATYTITEFIPDHTAYKYKLILTNSTGTSNIYTLTGATSRNDAAFIHFLSGREKVVTNTDVEKCVNIQAYANGYMSDYNHVGLWEQGYLYASTGQPEYLAVHSIDYANYIRTSSYIPENTECVRVSDGYVLDVFRYTLDGVFVDMLAKVTSLILNHAEYKYKARIRSTPATAIDRTCSTQVHFFGNSALHGGTEIADFGAPPRVYYRNSLSDHAEFAADTTAATVYAKYNELMTSNSGYITRQDIGSACDGQRLYAYTFAPTVITGDHTGVEPAKIIIVGGQHGFEKSNVFGTYYFLKDMCDNWTVNPVLDYFRHHVTLIVVPVLNPSGFDTSDYKNSNGVNLNRNYDHMWKLVNDITSDYYGGAEAFDQPETQALRSLILDNLDAVFVVDSHTKGKNSVTKYTDINWIACSKSNAPRYKKLAKACRRHISTMTAHLNVDYKLGLGNDTACGYYDGFTGGESVTPSLDNWCLDNGLVSMTFEGFNGFPGKSAHTPEVHKANAKLIGNWLLAICQVYGE